MTSTKSVLCNITQTKSHLEKNKENYSKCFQKVSELVNLDDEPKPSPLDFDEFLPWACLYFQSPDYVTVTKLHQEESPRKYRRSPRSTLSSFDSAITKSKINLPIKSNQTIQDSIAEEAKDKNQKKENRKQNKCDKSTKTPLCSFSNFFTTEPGEKIVEMKKLPIPINALYNRNNLIEVSIERCPIDINRIIMQVLGICAPYHRSLYKLTIRKGGLTATALYEIGKLLPHSHLTHVCLDDTFVPEANYHVLLEQVSQLKTLSLNRCFINDLVCQKLAANLDFEKPGTNLLTLELASNQITDIGARAFGVILRRNRSLVHLNLSGNLITDLGAFTILDHLMEFPLKLDEVLNMRRWRLNTLQQQSSYSMPTLASIESNYFRYMSTPKKYMSQMLPASETLQNFETQLGDSANKKVVYPFDSEQVVIKNSFHYCIGNMFLCSLNLAYNDLSYASVKKAHQVLRYQSQISKPASSIGLVRIVLDGNNIPKDCSDYIEMGTYLNKLISDQTPTSCFLRLRKSLRNKQSRDISLEKSK